MALYPLVRPKFFDNNSVLASGFQLFFYEVGSLTKKDTFTDSSLTTANPNPIILNSRGEPDNAGTPIDIYFPPGTVYKVVFTSPTDTDPPTAPTWTVDNVTDSSGLTSEWINERVAVYATATTFTVDSDLTAIYYPELRLKLTGGADRYATIVGASFSSPNTTITVNNVTDSGGGISSLNPLMGAVFLPIIGRDATSSLPILTDLTSTTDATKGGFIIGLYLSATAYVGRQLSQWIADRPYHLTDFGVVVDDTTPAVIAANNTAFQAAIDASNTKNTPLQLPGGTVHYNSTVTVPTAVRIFGTTRGFSSNTSSTLDYSGSGVGIDVTGNYVKLENFMLLQGGTGTIGVLLETNFNLLVNLTIMNKNTFPGWSTAGVTTNLIDTTSFTHTLRDCYLFGNAIGAHFNRSNNVIIDACFLESNGTNLKTFNCNNVTINNGTVIELFGDGAGSETNTSVALDIENTTGFICRDYYSEIASKSPIAIGQRFAILKNVRGGAIEGGIMTCQGLNAIDFSPIEIADDKVTHISIQHNYVSQLGTDAEFVEATGTGILANCVIGNNNFTTNAYEYNQSWTPSLLVGGDATGVTGTFKALFNRQGSSIHIHGRIALTSKGANTGTLTIGNLPLPMQARLDTNEYAVGLLLVANNGTQGIADSILWINSAGTTLGLRYRSTSSGGQSEYDAGNIQNGSTLHFDITYPVEPAR